MWWLLIPIAALIFSQKQVIEDTVQEHLDSWTQFDSLFILYGNAYGVNWKILKAIALNESNLGREPSVVRGLEVPTDIEGSKSSDGKSWGLMQVTLPTARDFEPEVTAIDLNNPDVSVSIAARLISSLFKQFSALDPRQLEWVIKSYNQGAGNTRKEQRGDIDGYAQEYWERFQRNYKRA